MPCLEKPAWLPSLNSVETLLLLYCAFSPSKAPGTTQRELLINLSNTNPGEVESSSTVPALATDRTNGSPAALVKRPTGTTTRTNQNRPEGAPLGTFIGPGAEAGRGWHEIFGNFFRGVGEVQQYHYLFCPLFPLGSIPQFLYAFSAAHVCAP